MLHYVSEESVQLREFECHSYLNGEFSSDNAPEIFSSAIYEFDAIPVWGGESFLHPRSHGILGTDENLEYEGGRRKIIRL
jgi:hypothetical protein